MKAMVALWELLFVMGALFLLGFMVGGLYSENREQHRMMNQAVERGHARFYLDDKNIRRWEWLPACRK